MIPDHNIASLPTLAEATANTHIAMLNAALPGWLAGYYLVGSAALGAFEGGFSDVDFIAAVSRSLTAPELEKLRGIHRSLGHRRHFAPLDGLYVPTDAFGGENDSCLRFNEGRYRGLTSFNPHSPDGWVLKRHGVCLYGPGPEALPFAPDWDRVCAGMMENLNTYWRRWVDGCRRIQPKALALYLRRDVLEWGVLGVTRLYYSLREQGVTSKAGAGGYALDTVPDRWHPVILEALRRRNPGIARQIPSPVKRRNDALEYMEFIIGAFGRPRKNSKPEHVKHGRAVFHQ